MTIKLPGRKTVYRLCIAISFGLMSLTLISNSNGPGPASTGAPQESTCADFNCHSAGSGITLDIDFGGATVYFPGQTYQLTITASNATAKRFGFQMTFLKSDNTKAGSYVLDDTSTKITSIFGREYVNHKSAPVNNSGTRTWTVKWVAPVTSQGNITFYTAVNAANGDGFATGDKIQKFSKVFNAAFGLGREETLPATAQLYIYPNPANGIVNIAYCLEETAEVEITLYDISGRNFSTLLHGIQSAGEHALVFNRDNGLPPGIYLLKIKSGKKHSVQKLLIQ